MRDSSHVLFISASVPLSITEEAFVQDEVTSIHQSGCKVMIAPMRRHLAQPNDAAVQSGVAALTISGSLVSAKIVFGALAAIVRSPRKTGKVIVNVLGRSGGRRNLATNLASLPKAFWLSGIVRRREVAHIHAYWLSHTATAAWAISQLTGVPWSATGYRWDIDAENLFSEKLPSASFLRCADEFGRNRLEAAARRMKCTTPIHLIRSGVRIEEAPRWEATPVRPLVVCCVGAFVAKKSQTLLVRAFKDLHDRHPDARLHLFGHGPCQDQIFAEVEAQRLHGAVEFHGTVPLSEVRAFLATRPITVLPSIITADKQQEGIPVTLIEAMAHGSPVISTRTGAIPCLVAPGCGILLDPGDVPGLSDALIGWSANPGDADEMSRRAFARVHAEFDITTTSRAMLQLIEGCTP